MFDLVVTSRARKTLRRIPENSRPRIEDMLRRIAADPESAGKKLRGALSDSHSTRLGKSMRIVYRIDKTNRVVTILDIAPRGDVYKHLR